MVPFPVSSSARPLPKMTHKQLQRLKRKVRSTYGGGIMAIAMVLCVLSIAWNKITSTATLAPRQIELEHEHYRRQLAQNASALPKCDTLLTNYPKEAFTWEAKKGGAVVLYILGVMYMFIALAIVCDEFFVPALEKIVDVAGISDDVGKWCLTGLVVLFDPLSFC
jgi:hypothetical protein